MLVQAIQTLGQYRFVTAPKRPPKLAVAGVDISVRADLLVQGATKGVDQIGAVVLRMTKDDATTQPAKQKRKEMGLYVATLAKMHLDIHNKTNRMPVNKLCMSIDVQHGEIFTAPPSITRRVSDLRTLAVVTCALQCLGQEEVATTLYCRERSISK